MAWYELGIKPLFETMLHKYSACQVNIWKNEITLNVFQENQMKSMTSK